MRRRAGSVREIFACVADTLNLCIYIERLYRRFRASSCEPGWPGWLRYQDEFCLGFIWEISAWFPGDEFWRQIRETKQTWRITKIITFTPIIASATLRAVSLQLNGMLMMRKIQQAMQDDAIRTARIHPGFNTGMNEVFIGQNFQLACRNLGSLHCSRPTHLSKGLFRWARLTGAGPVSDISPHL